MSLVFTDEQLEIRALAREFAEGEIRPQAPRWDQARKLDEDIFQKLAELGFLGMRIPEVYGGLGLDAGTYLLVLEELSRADAAVGLSVAIHNGPVTDILLRYGSDEQKETLLPAMASGELLGAFALSEQEAGSDAGSLTMAAVADGDGWRLSGTKRWVTNGRRAGRVLVFARIEGDAEPGGIGVFLVDPNSAGYSITGEEMTLGLRASETVSVELDGVQVSGDAVVGDLTSGFRYALGALDVGRAGIAAQAVGIAQAAMEYAMAYAQEREQFGRPISEFGAIRDKLANMAARIASARAMLHSLAASLDASDAGTIGGGLEGLTAQAAMAKLTASEAAYWVADEAVQIYGGYGYMKEYPVEKLMRDAKGTEIYEGTSEIMRLVIAREMLANK